MQIKTLFRIGLGVLWCTLFTELKAQSTHNSEVSINKITQACVLAEYPLPASSVDAALKKKFSESRLGSGSKASDGFRVYKGVVIAEVAPEKMDFYIRVDEQTSMSRVYMLASRGYDNFLKLPADSAAFQGMTLYLTRFEKEATAYNLAKLIEAEEENIKNLEKEGRKLSKEAARLQEDKSDSESDISRNTQEQEALKREMETQQRALEQVRSKTATIDQMDALKKEVDKQEKVTQKATKAFDKSVRSGADYRESLAKTEQEIIRNQQEQKELQQRTDAARDQLAKLRDSLSSLR